MSVARTVSRPCRFFKAANMAAVCPCAPADWLATVCVLLMLVGSTQAFPAGVMVTDDAGRRVTLEQPARRIVSLAPFITELLFAAGAGDAVVGVSEFSDYPEAARDIRQIGGGGGLDLEAIVALRPDLVIAWQSGNPTGQVERLQALGLRVFLSEPRQLGDVSQTLRRFGVLAGTGGIAKAGADAFERRHEQLQLKYAGQEPVSVFYQIWEHPLMTLNGKHLVSDVVRLCGGRNVFDALPSLAPQVDIEAVLAADPDVIIVAADEDSPMLSGWRQWPSMSAVAHGHIYAIGRDRLVRHGPRILEGAEQLCAILQRVRRE
jgi:iron complex transport system substrate-binding protein